MGIKALVSKKAVAIGLAGTIGLGAVGTATYAAAPGLVDRIVNSWAYTFDNELVKYRTEQNNSIPGKVGSAISSVTSSFSSYYDSKVTASKKKIDDDIKAYIAEKAHLSEEERKQVEAQFSERADKTTANITADLKATVDKQFAN